MKYPIVNFIFDQQLDKDLAWSFYSNPKYGGCNFWKERVLVYYPELKKMDSINNPKKYLNEFVSEHYSKNNKKMEFLGEKIRRSFRDKKNLYFLLVDKIFRNYPWPREKITGCFSMFDFCPRFLDWGGFQIFIYDKPKLQLFTIFHEILHFIFYDYAQKKFPKILGKMDTERGKFWDLAEIFNAVIQDRGGFIKLHGRIKNISYPSHRLILPKAKRILDKNNNVLNWIKEMIKILNISSK